MPMIQGTIIEIVRDKGYGFVETEDGRKIFFHQRWLKYIKFRELRVGQVVVFDINQGPRGFRAHNLIKAEDKDQFIKSRPIESLFK